MGSVYFRDQMTINILVTMGVSSRTTIASTITNRFQWMKMIIIMI